MYTKGYIKIHRKILDNGVFENAELLKVFVWCILKANSEPATVYGRQVKAGQFVTGRAAAAEELKLRPSTVYDRMKKLEKLKYITIDSNTKNSLITVLKYKSYQSTKPSKRDLDAAADKFTDEVMQYTEYDTVMLEEFISYWTEPNRSNTKLRYEIEKTFAVKRRLKTWAANQNKFNNQQPQKANIFDSWQAARNIIENG